MRLTERLRRHIVAGFLASAAVAVACIDMSAPPGAAAISLLQLPSPFVVAGDTMRDSLGKVAPVTVTSFNVEGLPIPEIPFETFVLDTMLRAHFTVEHFLVGDKVGNVTVVGQASGVQTLTINVPVTARPATLLLGTPLPDTIRAPLGGTDTTDKKQLATIVRGAGDTTVQGVIVHYRLSKTLGSSSPTIPAVYISDASGKPMNADTTNAGGVASNRYVTVLTRLLTDQALLNGQKVETVLVEATASYAGKQLTNSPLTMVYPVKVIISVR